MKRVFIVFRNTDTLFIVFRKKIKTKFPPKSIFVEINIENRENLIFAIAVFCQGTCG
jgi:hypothetical protein